MASKHKSGLDDPKPFPSECYEFSLTDHHEDPRMPLQQAEGDDGIAAQGAPLIRRTNARYDLRPAPSPATARPGAGSNAEEDVPTTTNTCTKVDSRSRKRGPTTTVHEGDLPLSFSTWDYDSESRQQAAASDDQTSDCSEGNSIDKISLEAQTTLGHNSLACDDSGQLPLTSPDTAEEQTRNVEHARDEAHEVENAYGGTSPPKRTRRSQD